jgi:hypothetical protein
MNLRALKETPPWDWPEGVSQQLLEVLLDERGSESERLLAAELAADFTVINDELVSALLASLENASSSQELRAQAAISLGPILEHADLEGFDDPEEMPISEETVQSVQSALHRQFEDEGAPKLVRRRSLESSVRAPLPWHTEALRTAYASGDVAWTLTAVFGMRFVRGFDRQILEALDSKDPDVHVEAVLAAGNWQLEAAFSRVLALVGSAQTEKPLLLAAIDALASIRPREAESLLAELTDSDDEDIAEAVFEAIAMAESATEEEDENQGGNNVLH